MMRLGTRIATVALAFAVAGTAAANQLAKFRLRDHPDGNRNPPPYGLRLDNLFTHNSVVGAAGGTTTFSMNHFGDTYLTVSLNGLNLEINIAGTLYGGEDSGTTYGFGEGSYAVDFTYTAGVVASGNGWIVQPGGSGSGTLTAGAGITGVTSGTVFDFVADGVANNAGTGNQDAMFAFLDSGYRLSGSGNEFVGIGWLANKDGNGNILRSGTQDWIFTIIPLPSTAGLAMAGLGMIAIRRRR